MMRIHILKVSLLAICLFPTQAQFSTEFIEEEEQLFPNEEALIIVTENLENNAETSFETSTPLTPELAIPIPVNLTLPGDRAAANLRDSASRLTQVGGRVAIRNEDGTASIVPVIGLANILLSRAGPIGNLGSNIQIEMPNGGKVPFIYIDPNEGESTIQGLNYFSETTTVLPTEAPDIPSYELTPAYQAASNSNYAASNLDRIHEYVVYTNSDGIIRIVNASDLAQEARHQANLLSAVSENNYNVVVPNHGDFKFAEIRKIDGFDSVYGIVLSYNGSVGVIIQKPDSPTIIFVKSTVIPPQLTNTTVAADVAVSNLQDSVSKLNEINGIVVLMDSEGKVNIVESGELARLLINQADGYSKLGTIPVITFNDGKIPFEPLVMTEVIPTIISSTIPKTVTLVKMTY